MFKGLFFSDFAALGDPKPPPPPLGEGGVKQPCVAAAAAAIKEGDRISLSRPEEGEGGVGGGFRSPNIGISPPF